MEYNGVYEALQLAATNEQKTREFYLQSAERIDDACAKEMFRTLAAEEEKHLRMVQRQYESLKGGEGWVEFAEKAMTHNFPPLEERVASENPLKPTTSDLDALLFAIQLEHDSYELYRGMIGKTDDPAGKQMFRYLAEAEQRHFDTFMENYRYMTETGGFLGLGARKCD